MMKAIHAVPQPLKEIFDNKKSYKIPDYQRPYSWTTDECDQLWQDLITFYEYSQSKDYDHSPYFLGNMVYHKEKDKDTDKEIYYVVDGQQRLTTLSILLKILQEKAVDYTSLYKLIWKTEEGLDGKTIKKVPLELNIESEVLGGIESGLFINIMNLEVANQEKSNYINNYTLLKNKVNEWHSKNENKNNYKKLIDTIIEKVILLPILCDDQDHALTIFETINNRGRSLTDADIFKSHLYKIALKNNTKDNFIKTWDDLSENSKNILDLFRIYIQVIRGQKPDILPEIALRKFFTIKPIEKRAGLVLSEQNSWEKTTEDLNKLSLCEQYLNDYSPDNIRKWWKILALGKSTYMHYILYIYLFYKLDQSDNNEPSLPNNFEKDFENLCEATVKYFYGKRLCNITQANMKYLVFNAIKIFTAKKDYKEIIIYFEKDIKNNSNAIENNIEQNEFGQVKNQLIYILAYIDPDQQYININNVHVEHILPKNWEHYEYSQWNKELVEKHKNHLGNLTLLEAPLNIQARNFVFRHKKDKAYEKSNFKEVKSLLDYQNWDINAFEERDRNSKSKLKKFFSEYDY